MQFMYKSLLGLAFAASSVAAVEDTSFTYGGIYKSLKTAQQTEFSQLSLNFYLRQTDNGAICPTSRVYLSDGEQQYPLSVTATGKLLLPLDKKLKQNHAAITLEMSKPAQCHLAMEIAVANDELENVTVKKVQGWLVQLNAMYATLAGWPGKYFMPAITGLKFNLEDAKRPQLVTGESKQPLSLDEQNNYLLTLAALQNIDSPARFDFGQGATLLKVTPVLEK